VRVKLSTSPEFPGREAWNDFVAASAMGRLLQSYEWGEFKVKFGWQAIRLAVEEGGQIVAGAQLLLRRLPLGSFAYVPEGPIVDLESEAATTLLSAIHQVAQGEGAIFLKIEPNLDEDPSLGQRLQDLGFRPSNQRIQPRSTMALDLTADLDAILARMKAKTRYNIRLAGRRGVVVREGGESDLGAFYRLMQMTSRRDGFPIHVREYYDEAWRLFVSPGRGRFLLASYRGELLAGLMVFAFGREAWYMYGASSNRHRSLMPNHLLQWEAIKWAKGQGYSTYDLGGIPDEVRALAEDEALQRRDGLWGLYRFKRGFGGEVKRSIGPYDYVYSRPLYSLYGLSAGALLRLREKMRFWCFSGLPQR